MAHSLLHLFFMEVLIVRGGIQLWSGAVHLIRAGVMLRNREGRQGVLLKYLLGGRPAFQALPLIITSDDCAIGPLIVDSSERCSQTWLFKSTLNFNMTC